jgi:hypothetical protein
VHLFVQVPRHADGDDRLFRGVGHGLGVSVEDSRA